MVNGILAHIPLPDNQSILGNCNIPLLASLSKAAHSSGIPVCVGCPVLYLCGVEPNFGCQIPRVRSMILFIYIMS